MNKLILITAVVLSVIIRLFLIINGKHVADVWAIAKMGEVLLNGQNPYLTLDFNVYPPLSVFISALSQITGSLTNTSFHIIIKIWPNLADLATAFIVYKLLIKQKIKPVFASLWTGFFLLNPVSIIISAAHGQLDSVSTFLVVLAIFYLNTHPKISAFVLGLSIAVKPNPLILLPLFLLVVSKKIRIRYLLISLTPVILTLIPFIFTKPLQVIGNLLTYSGITDFGFAAILRGIFFQDNANPNLPALLVSQFLNISKILLLTSLAFIIFLLRKKKYITVSILIVYLLFISIYFGIGAQYLSWIIPFAVILRQRMVLVYTATATIALIGFYLYFGPDLLLGKLAGNMLPFTNKYMYYYFYGNLLLWITCLIWLIYLLIKIPKFVSFIRSAGSKDISNE